MIGTLTVFNQLAQQGQARVVYQTGSVTIWQIPGDAAT